MMLRRPLLCAGLIALMLPAAGTAQESTAQDGTAQDSPAVPDYQVFDLESLDREADPCVDFYQYACGGWHAKHPMPPNETFWSRPFTQFSRQVDAYVQALVEEAATAEGQRTGDEQKVGDYFAACMDTDSIEQRGLAPLRQELAVVESLESIDELAAVLGSLQRTLPWYPQDGEPILYVAVIADPGDAGMALRIGPSGLGLPGPDYYTRTDEEAKALQNRYRFHIAEMLGLLGSNDVEAGDRAEEILALETALAKAYLPKSERRNDPALTANPMSVAHLQSLTPRFRWDDFFRAHGLPARGRVNPAELGYLRALDRELTETPLRTWKAYLRWQILSERAKHLPASVRGARFAFFGRSLHQQDLPPERARVCVDALKTDLPNELGRLFVAYAFRPDMRERAHTMFTEIQAVVRDRIRKAQWMAPETKREALAKVDTVQLRVGHPDTWLDDDRVVIRRDDHYGNVRRTGAALRRVSFDRLGRRPDAAWWSAPVTWVGGYYSAAENAIVITAAMMLHLDHGNDDPAVAYGALGQLLAHELIHGFDPHGRSFDASGRPRDWWTAADSARFEARAQCVADEFSRFEYAPGIPVDGAYVVSEQFTEIAAWSIAWEAYQAATDGHNQESVAGLTPPQRYFITGAQTWCAEATDGEWRARASGGSSKAWAAPMVHGTVLNTRHFAAAFGCRAGEPMVKPAAEVCETW